MDVDDGDTEGEPSQQPANLDYSGLSYWFEQYIINDDSEKIMQYALLVAGANKGESVSFYPENSADPDLQTNAFWALLDTPQWSSYHTFLD